MRTMAERVQFKKILVLKLEELGVKIKWLVVNRQS
jgi:hypothetical protein